MWCRSQLIPCESWTLRTFLRCVRGSGPPAVVIYVSGTEDPGALTTLRRSRMRRQHLPSCGPLVIFARMRYPEPPQYSDPHAWTITGALAPPDVWERILKFHCTPLHTLWISKLVQVVPSGGSCFRSVEWEKSKGRSGSSLHTFPAGSRGACDLVLADGADIIGVMDHLIEDLPYRRLCYYPGHNFVHADYGDQDGKAAPRRTMWIADGPHARWRKLYYLPENLR